MKLEVDINEAENIKTDQINQNSVFLKINKRNGPLTNLI